MNLETSKKCLKVFGILNIIFGVIGTIFAFLALIGGSAISIDSAMNNTPVEQDLQMGIGVAVILGVILLITGIIDIIEGILDLRAVKDISKIMPAWIFSIIGLVSVIFDIVKFISDKNYTGSTICGLIIAVVISIVTFMAASTIKNAAGK